MKALFSLIFLSFFLSACATQKTAEPVDLSLIDEKKLERAQALYKCSSFLKLFTEARAHRNDPAEHTQLTIEKYEAGKTLGREILLQTAEGIDIDKKKLTSTVAANGYMQALDMVREIGASSDPNIKDEMFLTCFHKIRKEELLNTVNAFGGRPIE